VRELAHPQPTVCNRPLSTFTQSRIVHVLPRYAGSEHLGLTDLGEISNWGHPLSVALSYIRIVLTPGTEPRSLIGALRNQWQGIGKKPSKWLALSFLVVGVLGAISSGALGMEIMEQTHPGSLALALIIFEVSMAFMLSGNAIWFTLKKKARSGERLRM
jgi:hypothetical protein